MNENVKFAMDELDYLMVKVSRVHGNHHPELISIRECYENISKGIKENDENLIKENLNKASELSNGFTLPSDACQAYTRVYNAFKMLVEEYK